MKRFALEVWNQFKSPWTWVLVAICAGMSSLASSQNQAVGKIPMMQFTLGLESFAIGLWLLPVFNMTFALIGNADPMEVMRYRSSTNWMLRGYLNLALPRLLIFTLVPVTIFLAWSAGSPVTQGSRWYGDTALQPLCLSGVVCTPLPSPIVFLWLSLVNYFVVGTFYWLVLAFAFNRGVSEDQLKLVACTLALWPGLLASFATFNIHMIGWLSVWMLDPVQAWRSVGDPFAGIWLFLALSCLLILTNYALSLRRKTSKRPPLLVYFACASFIIGVLVSTSTDTSQHFMPALMSAFAGQGWQFSATAWPSTFCLLALFVAPSTLIGSGTGSLLRSAIQTLALVVVGFGGLAAGVYATQRNGMFDIASFLNWGFAGVVAVISLQCLVYSMLSRLSPLNLNLRILSILALSGLAVALRTKMPYLPIGFESQALAKPAGRISLAGEIIALGIMLCLLLAFSLIKNRRSVSK